MTLDEYNRFCASLPQATHVVQWGDAHVWKVGGKVFVLGRERGEGEPEMAISFKCSPMAYELLSEQPGLRPAPYLASRGLKWIQRYSGESMDDQTLCDYLAASYRLVVAGLSRKLRRELNIDPD
ncbi:hypothetical protein GCM10011385_15500 [Nitratireductor aestuarii]|uniref:MmcQ/YjbR family DNA-binding protein n=1 Tax=Nitratireductor aestuarii TaxID=1735103 RepID=A0A916RN18_9HYPH|nr:MmcQ/YjbR family DNA-binding protein [Nitratireductor aestuarii]GGA62595.1 hypothetical protein GCM10011385_15500 [Nitratireductor aestuarii]